MSKPINVLQQRKIFIHPPSSPSSATATGSFFSTQDGRTSCQFPSSALGHRLCVKSHAAKLSRFWTLHLAAGRTHVLHFGTKRRMMRVTSSLEVTAAQRWRYDAGGRCLRNAPSRERLGDVTALVETGSTEKVVSMGAADNGIEAMIHRKR